MIKSTIATLLLGTSLVCASPVFAGPSNDTSSSVDTPNATAAQPKAHAPSPGTVGAMNGTEGGSFTASKADQDKNLTKSK